MAFDRHSAKKQKPAEPERPPRREIERLEPDPKQGLSEEQVKLRAEAGWLNYDTSVPTKSEKQIVIKNLCTVFNLVNVVFAVALLCVGSFKNMLFMGVVVCNAGIGIFQEIRAKRAVDALSFINAAKAHVIRGGETKDVRLNEIVVDDIISLSSGNQVPTDCRVVSGFCEADESFLTGESDPISKNIGDTVMAGSFIVSGSCRARAEHVAEDNYISKISSSAKYVKKVNSEIMSTMTAIVTVISIALIPISVLLFRNQLALPGTSLRDAIIQTVGALVGMVPGGLILLTSTVLAASVVRLAQRSVLVQELYCIETLARVDTLCLDKTGTITEGTMTLADTIVYDDEAEALIPDALSSLTDALQDRNATFTAIAEKYSGKAPWRAEKTAPFSSRTKWSGATFAGKGTYILGAAEFVMPARDVHLQEALFEYSRDYRVLLLARTNEPLPESGLPSGLCPIALLLLQDNIRKEAPATLKFFKKEGVDIKVISGDGVDTVANIARRAGVESWNKCVDASTLKPEDIPEACEKYAVFGRVTPEQKKLLVKALQKKGHTVAMTGDGVNDVMALKESDCAIAIAGGADAARNVAHLVLLKSNFDALPKIVAEGRRSINNIQRSASLFLIKTVFASILAVAFLFIATSYPFQPIQLTLISTTTIGIPSVVLGLQPNHDRLRGRFLPNVMRSAAPCGITVAAVILLIVWCGLTFGLPQDQVSSLCVLFTGSICLLLLFYVCHPWTPVRTALFFSMLALFFIGYIFFKPFFALVDFSGKSWLLLVIVAAVGYCMFRVLWQVFHGQHINIFPTTPTEAPDREGAGRAAKR
jgi:cation-transporting ATPase E